ncbi:MAG: hypothetical protein ABIO35_04000 [Nitrobacter sp.]
MVRTEARHAPAARLVCAFSAGKSKLFKENCSLKFDHRNGRDIVSFNQAAAALDNLSNIVKQSDFSTEMPFSSTKVTLTELWRRDL